MKNAKSPVDSAARSLSKPAKASADGSAKKLALASSNAIHDLELAIPYLVARAGMRMGQAFTRELKKFDLTLTEWRVCVSLRHKPHQRLSELASRTSTEASTLSRTAEGLLQRGLLIRDRSDNDARALALSLTDEGMLLTERIVPLAQLYEKVALSGLKPAQVELLRDMLHRVYDNMEALDPGD